MYLSIAHVAHVHLCPPPRSVRCGGPPLSNGLLSYKVGRVFRPLLLLGKHNQRFKLAESIHHPVAQTLPVCSNITILCKVFSLYCCNGAISVTFFWFT